MRLSGAAGLVTLPPSLLDTVSCVEAQGVALPAGVPEGGSAPPPTPVITLRLTPTLAGFFHSRTPLPLDSPQNLLNQNP